MITNCVFNLMDMVWLSETMKPYNGETSSKTYYWPRMSNDHHIKGVAMGISSRLPSSLVEVNPDDERIMQLKLKHKLGFMFVIAVCASTETCETENVLCQTRICTGSVSPS